MAIEPSDVPQSCDYQGWHFGAAYPDAQCVEGYLWDEDSCDEPGSPLLSGGDIPCPKCNSVEHAAYYAEEVSGPAPVMSAANATHRLLCRHVCRWTKEYTMRCHVLKKMADGRLKLLVFGERNWKNTEHVSRVRYVEAGRVTLVAPVDH